MTISAPDGTVEQLRVFVSPMAWGPNARIRRRGNWRNGKTNPDAARVPSQAKLPGPPGIDSIRPSKAFIRSRLAYFIAFGGGAGLSPLCSRHRGYTCGFPLVLDPGLLLRSACSSRPGRIDVSHRYLGLRCHRHARSAITIMAAWFGMKLPLSRWYSSLRHRLSCGRHLHFCCFVCSI